MGDMTSQRTITSVAITLAAAAALGVVGCEKQSSTTPADATERDTTGGVADVDDVSRDDDDDDDDDRSDGPSILSKSSFDETIIEHYGDVSDCYVAALDGNPKLEGALQAEFTIDAEGRAVSVVVVDGSTLSDAGLVECIGAAAANWSFDRPAGGEMTLPYTFNLAPG
jgi:hypothetical protein